MSVVSELEIRLFAGIARLQQDMDRARQTVDGAMNRISASVGNAMKMVAGFAAALSVGAFVNFVKGAIDAVDALNDMSARTKVAIEDLAGLAYGAKLSDTSLEGVASSITKLSQNIGKDGAKFRELGITASEPLEAFKQLADVFKGIQDPQQRAAFGAEALGKSWQEAAVLLDSGSEGIAAMITQGKELSGITEQIAGDAGAFNDKLDELGFAAQGAGTRIAAGLLPTLNQIVESMSSSAVKGDTLKGVVIALSGVLKILYTVGVGVVEVFSTMGRAIGAAAAMTMQVLNGDFAAAWQTYKDLGSDIADGWGDAARRVAMAWSSATKDVAKEAAESGEAVVDAGRKVAAFLNSGGISAARKKATDEAMAFYSKTRDASIDHLMQLEAERDGQVALSAEEKKRIEILNDLLKFGKNLTEQQRADVQGWAEAIPVLAKYNKELERVKALREQREAESYSDVSSAQEQTQALKDQIKYYGLAEDAVLKLKAAEIKRGLDGGYVDDIERGRLQGLLDATNEQIELQGKLSSMKSESTFWAGLEDTAHQTFLSIANGSKDTATRLKETFKNVFFDWLYQMTIKKWIINIGTSLSGNSAVSSIADAVGGSSSSGIGGLFSSGSSLLSIGKTIYQGFSVGVASSMGGTIASLGNLFGSQAVSAFGTGMTLTASQASTAAAAYAASGNTVAAGGLTAGAGAASAVPIIGWIIAGMAAANGFMKQGFTPNNGTLVGVGKAIAAPTNMTNNFLDKLGVGKTLANIISGAAINTKLFGRADPRVESQGLRGTVSASGIDADTYANIVEKGGFFRSTKRYQRTADLAAETDTAWDEQIKSMITAVKGFGSALGIQASVIDGYTKAFDVKLTGDETKDNEAVVALFAAISDEMSARLVPSLASFKAEGETLSATLLRLVNNYTTADAALTAIGKAVGVVGVAGIEARERLIAAAGGLQNLVEGIAYFQQNYLSEAERIAPLQKQVTAALAEMGKSSIKTEADFKAAALGIDVSTQAGADLFAKMMALAPAFKAVADYAANVSGEAAARQVLAAAYETESAAIASTIEKLETFASAIKSFREGLVLGSLSTLSFAEKAAAARDQYSSTVSAARGGDLAAQSGFSGAATAFLTASQAGAASRLDYIRDYARVQADMVILAASVGSQLTDAEKQQAALDKQVEGLITLNDSVKAGAVTVAQAIASLGVLGVKQIDGSHAGGLSRVPFDGYTAELHAGERVLTAFEAREYSARPSGGIGELTAAIDRLNEENRALRAELTEFKSQSQAADVSMAQSLGKVARLADRWDSNGLLVRADGPLPTKETVTP